MRTGQSALGGEPVGGPEFELTHAADHFRPAACATAAISIESVGDSSPDRLDHLVVGLPALVAVGDVALLP